MDIPKSNMAKNILEEYTTGKTSLRDVARACGTDHHSVKRVLVSNGVDIVPKTNREFTDAHRKNISDACKGRISWSKGQKMSKSSLYKNMASHLRFNVEADWLAQFDDIEKLKTLNKAVTERGGRFDFSDDLYKEYINKFYYCAQFNSIYNNWIKSGKEYYRTPSLDHIVPRSKGGTNAISNLQFLTWFENRCKNDMTQCEWDEMKADINSYFVASK